MFVTCENCGTAYKIDQQKIPDTKSFVKCSSCDNPISLSPEKNPEQNIEKSKKIVECEQCNSLYAIPLTKFITDIIKVRCGKCNNQFHVNKDSNAQDENKNVSSDGDKLGLNGIEIPDENKVEVQGLFDDLDDKPQVDELESEDSDEIEELDTPISSLTNPTEEYLDSINLSLSDENDEEDDLGLGTVSPENKHKFFLKPNEKSDEISISDEVSDGINQQDNDWPEIQDETVGTLFDLDGDETDSGNGDTEEVVDLNDIKNDYVALDIKDENKNSEDEKRETKSGSKKTVIWIIFIIILLVFLLAGGFLIFNQKVTQLIPLKITQSGKISKINIIEPLEGKYLKNKNYKNKIFILNGKLQNFYKVDEKITSVEVTGFLHNGKDKVVAKATVYAGNNLTDFQAKNWTKGKIKSFLTFQLGKDNDNLDLDFNQIIPFQIVFFNAPEGIEKLEARISSFLEKGKKVDLEKLDKKFLKK